MRLRDFVGIFKINRLRLTKKERLVDNVYLFEFTSKNKINWEAGQYGFFWFWEVRKRKYRIFTIASTKEENKIMIATIIGKNPSPFKERLLNMRIDQKILMIGPVGWLYVSDYQIPNALIAGGIGVTPIRSMLKAIDTEKIADIEVFYIDTRKDFLFKEEIAAIKNKKVKIHFLDNKNEFKEKLAAFRNKYQNAKYFISGPPMMIKQVRDDLIKNNIKKNRIIYDPFIGY